MFTVCLVIDNGF